MYSSFTHPSATRNHIWVAIPITACIASGDPFRARARWGEEGEATENSFSQSCTAEKWRLLKNPLSFRIMNTVALILCISTVDAECILFSIVSSDSPRLLLLPPLLCIYSRQDTGRYTCPEPRTSSTIRNKLWVCRRGGGGGWGSAESKLKMKKSLPEITMITEVLFSKKLLIVRQHNVWSKISLLKGGGFD